MTDIPPATIRVSLEIPHSTLMSVVHSAWFYDSHGISYWADRKSDSRARWYVREKHEENDVLDRIRWKPGPWRRVSERAIKRGLALMVKAAPKQLARLIEGNADATTGDVLIQLAVLGEVRYG